MIPKACYGKIWNLTRQDVGAGRGLSRCAVWTVKRVLSSDLGFEGCCGESRRFHMGSGRVGHVDNLRRWTWEWDAPPPPQVLSVRKLQGLWGQVREGSRARAP